MDDFSLCDKIWAAVDHAYYEQNPNWADEEPEYRRMDCVFATKFSKHWCLGFVLHDFEYDALSGGLDTFFLRQEGVTNKETLDAFVIVGADEYVEPFKEAITIFDSFRSTLFNWNWERREEEWGDEFNRFSFALTDCCSKIDDLMGVKDPRTYLAEYIRENLHLYQK